jgi:hypothetical protein
MTSRPESEAHREAEKPRGAIPGPHGPPWSPLGQSGEVIGVITGDSITGLHNGGERRLASTVSTAPRQARTSERGRRGSPPIESSTGALKHTGAWVTRDFGLTRIMHEPPAATADMAVLPGVLECSFNRLRTSSPCAVLTSTPQVQSRGAAGWLPGTRRKRLRCAWHDRLHDLATASRA